MVSCKSVTRYNAQLEKKIDPILLRQDTDEAFNNLKKFHPELFRYTSEQQLTYKFDSLKTSINQPLTPNEFYFKLAPIISQVKEGHLRLRPRPRRYTSSEENSLKNKTALLGQLNYRIVNDKLFIISSNNKNIKVKQGSEVLKIDDNSVSDLISKYKKLINSDGYNTTYQKYNLNDLFFKFYTLEKGLLNSTTLLIKQDDITQKITLLRSDKSKEDIKTKENVIKALSDKRINDYNAITNTYNRSMKFLAPDSSIAYIKIKTFSATAASRFYKKSFAEIKNGKTKYLILDIRNNLGGSLSEINTLYSYLSKENFTLIKTPEMNFKTAALHRNYFYGQSPLMNIFSSLGYPAFMLANYAISSKGNDGKYYFKEFSAKPTKIKKDAFAGQIFVLINGSSFSASSVLAAKLKDDQRATLVGEETGGAHDATVAGFYNTVTLKNSQLKLPIGLLLIQPNVKPQNNSRGVIPDIILPPSFNQIPDNKDVELEWVLNYIKNKSD